MENMHQNPPSASEWLASAKSDASAQNVGMYLLHNGVVRVTSKAAARFGQTDDKPVAGMEVSYDREKLEEIKRATCAMAGVQVVKVWINEGSLHVGDDLMYVLIGGDIRPHVIGALEYMVGRIKSECIQEKELF
ncbi:MAG: molybdenum cofactor biosynthesis protein MoaE [Clostridia bacterium]|nr:molybdenum cofactor biosynthesis protein MoaE [Clostridia bacterium]